MLIYGSYGLLFLAGLGLLVVLSIGRTTESAVKSFTSMETPQFLLLLAGAAVLTLAFLSGISMVIIILVGFVLLILVPLAIVLMIRSEVIKRTWKQKDERAEAFKFESMIKKDPNNVVAHIGLAKVFEDHNRYEQAAEEYHVAAQLYPESESGYAERLEQKEKLMRRMLAIEEKKKTFVCPQCSSKNRPQERKCSKCSKPLYASTFEWMWKNISNPAKLAAGAVIVVSLIYLFWLPPMYSVALMAVWLAVIVYFSLPVEFLLSD
jgi:Na+-transporting methylmalonyl-CoA/oxaloacetate decarboxylase gamma subunit